MKRFLVSCIALSSAYGAAMAQSISGTVLDAETQEPLAGVSVIEPGTTNGVTTDENGHYTLKLTKGQQLVFSYIGYERHSERVAGRTVIDITMATDDNLLGEAIVVGYQTLRKHDVTGAVSRVDSKDLTSLSLASTEQALQGRISGVQVSSATGAPGSDISIRVRGVGSIFSNNAPLYIIDGVPSANGLQGISPNDIDDITVLKDASSAAVYGSRATNGVVLVTTKRGKKGKTQVSYSGNVGVQQVAGLIDMVNTKDYVTIYNEAANNDNAFAAGPTFMRSLIPDDVLPLLADVNHVSEIFRPAAITSHELSFSGGNENTTFLVSGSYNKQDGIISGSGYERATLRSNINSKLKPWLEMGANINGSLSNQKSISESGDGYGNDQGGSIVRYAMFRNPAIPIYNNAGEFVDKPSGYFPVDPTRNYDSWFGDGYSPEGLCHYTDREKRTKTFFARLNGKITLPLDLFLNSNFGVDYRDYEQQAYHASWGDGNRINAENSMTIGREQNLNWTFNTTLNYVHTFGDDHHLNALAGFEANRETGKTTNLSDKNFELWNKDLIYIGNGTAVGEGSTTNVVASTGAWAATLASFIAQANYNYADRYFLGLTLREDGTSRFAANNRWGTFYSASAGWDITREGFMRDQSIFDLLKLRVGYGVIGNQNVGLYAYSDRYSRNHTYYFGPGSVNGYAQAILGNDNLKWESSKQMNVGIDMRFLKGALNASVDFYNKITDNMLMQASYPISAGTSSTPWINSGRVLNRGIDVEVAYHLFRGDWRFNATLNGGYLYNEVLDVSAPIVGGRVDNEIYATLTSVGHPIGAFFMYQMDGIFQDKTEILTSAFQGSDVHPGDVKYKDINGDAVIDSKDRDYCGSSIPAFTMGLNLNLQWKGWDLTAFFQGAYGHKIYNQILTDSEGFYRGFTVTQRYFDNRWTPENPSNLYPRASWNAKSNNARVSTRFLEDASYTRLKNIQLGYTFDAEKMKNIEHLRFYVSATNLFTLTGYSGFDPEMTVSANSRSEGDRANGIDWGTYPNSRTYTFGVNITF